MPYDESTPVVVPNPRRLEQYVFTVTIDKDGQVTSETLRRFLVTAWIDGIPHGYWSDPDPELGWNQYPSLVALPRPGVRMLGDGDVWKARPTGRVWLFHDVLSAPVTDDERGTFHELLAADYAKWKNDPDEWMAEHV